jgi:hypothetical protein
MVMKPICIPLSQIIQFASQQKHVIINQKRGFDNHYMLKGATYVGEAKTLQPYSIFVETYVVGR